MKQTTIVAINTVNYGSTGNIMKDIADYSRKYGFNYYTFSRQSENNKIKNHEFFGNRYERYINSKLSTILGIDFFLIDSGTNKLINKLKVISPDIIHLHNMHGSYINYKKLFRFINKNKIKVVWTLHDCWSFTGKCPHFTIYNCNKWKDKCSKCPQLQEYPKKILDLTGYMYEEKKKIFSTIDDLNIVAVSNWLGKVCKSSFLKKHAIEVIPNGVDIIKFKQSKNRYLRDEYNLGDKFIILGVASPWSNRKGLDDFIRLSEIIEKDKYKIVLIGLNRQQIEICSEYGILGLERTSNQEELIQWYSESGVFFNPSREESFGLVTVEAMACGTPVIVYNSTASPEVIEGTECYCLDNTMIDNVKLAIDDIYNNQKIKDYYKVRKVVEERYSKYNQMEKYFKLYKKILRDTIEY